MNLIQYMRTQTENTHTAITSLPPERQLHTTPAWPFLESA